MEICKGFFVHQLIRTAHKKRDIASSAMSLFFFMFAVALLTKKGHCLSAMSLFFFMFAVALLTKKGHCLSAMSLWVPGRTRTVDIQNHKQSCECLINPVFIGVSAIFDFLFAAILRLFTQGPILFQ